jgi:hypothetical protein
LLCPIAKLRSGSSAGSARGARRFLEVCLSGLFLATLFIASKTDDTGGEQ